jgi:FtsZ-binding cell division protein ZapB
MAISATDKFNELESRIERTIELVRTTRQEKDVAVKELALARKRMGELERENEELKRERELVKNKVESLLDNLSELTEESLV